MSKILLRLFVEIGGQELESFETFDFRQSFQDPSFRQSSLRPLFL